MVQKYLFRELYLLRISSICKSEYFSSKFFDWPKMSPKFSDLKVSSYDYIRDYVIIP